MFFMAYILLLDICFWFCLLYIQLELLNTTHSVTNQSTNTGYMSIYVNHYLAMVSFLVFGLSDSQQSLRPKLYILLSYHLKHNAIEQFFTYRVIGSVNLTNTNKVRCPFLHALHVIDKHCALVWWSWQGEAGNLLKGGHWACCTSPME